MMQDNTENYAHVRARAITTLQCANVSIKRDELDEAIYNLMLNEGMSFEDALATLPIGKYLTIDVSTMQQPASLTVPTAPELHDEHWQAPAGYGLEQWDAVYERPVTININDSTRGPCPGKCLWGASAQNPCEFGIGHRGPCGTFPRAHESAD